MSAPPPKPARRRARQAGGAKASDEGTTDAGASVERRDDAVAESKTDEELAQQMAEEKSKGKADRGNRSENSPTRPPREDKDSKETRRGVDFDKGTAGGDADAAAPAKGPPKKAPKPTGLDLAGAGKSDAEERDEILVRATGKQPGTGMLDSLNSLLFSRFGYRMGSQSTAAAHNTVPYTIRGGAADTVWALCVNIHSMLADTTGLVRPAIKVHAVYKDSGMYVKSIRMPAVQPLSTKHITLDDLTAATPMWHENLLLAARFQDVINDDTLLLFEVLDQRPSLQTNAAAPAVRQAKRVAWAYLQPVSNGKLNVGVCPEWKHTAAHDASAAPDSGRRGDKDKSTKSAGAGAEAKEAKEAKETDLVPEMMAGNRHKKVKLQLYFTVEHDGVVGALQRSLMGWPEPKVEHADRQGKCDSYPDGVPSVYLQWRRHTHEPIPKGQLVLELGPQEAEFSGSSSGVTTAAVDSQHRMSMGTDAPIPAEAELIRSEPKSLQNKAKSYAIKRLRAPREPCAIPDKVLHRIDVGPEGAMTIKYSHSGHLLAVGAKSPTVPALYSGNVASSHILGEAYSLKMYDTDSGELIWCQESAHHGVIYSISWSLDNSYLLTASGDGTVKVWDMSALLPNSNDVNASFDKGDATEPFCLHSHTASPPAYMYSAVFQEFAPNIRGGTSNIVNNIIIQEEFLTSKLRNELPRVIAGGSDGRIRVWDEGVFKGYISAEDESELTANDSAPAAHNGCRVQALSIDSRSRYLISGDSIGNLFVWRTDAKGWYQLLRRFKQEEISTETTMTQLQRRDAMLMQSGGVQSVVMNMDKTKSQVLVLNQCPPHLKLYSTSTYKPIATCAGVGSGQVASKSKVTKASVSTSGAVFGRAEFSPDGRFAVAGISAQSANSDGHYNLKVWEAKQGNVYPAVLSEINLPYPVRSISWHPEQHVMAVSMVGMGAAVVIYSGERESAELAIGRMAGDALDGHMQTAQEASTAPNSPARNASLNASTRSSPKAAKSK